MAYPLPCRKKEGVNPLYDLLKTMRGYPEFSSEFILASISPLLIPLFLAIELMLRTQISHGWNMFLSGGGLVAKQVLGHTISASIFRTFGICGETQAHQWLETHCTLCEPMEAEHKSFYSAFSEWLKRLYILSESAAAGVIPSYVAAEFWKWQRKSSNFASSKFALKRNIIKALSCIVH